VRFFQNIEMMMYHLFQRLVDISFTLPGSHMRVNIFLILPTKS